MRTVLALLLLATPLLAAPVPKAKPRESLDGPWEVVERHVSGTKDEVTITNRWTIEGESVVIQMAGRGGALKRVEGTTYKLVRPKDGGENDLDFTVLHTGGNSPPSTFRGIMERDGDTFKFCRAESPDYCRPTECKPAEGNVLYVFKRVNAAK